MKYALYAGSHFLMASNEIDKLKATRNQVMTWLNEMGLPSDSRQELSIIDTDNRRDLYTAKYNPALNIRWKETNFGYNHIRSLSSVKYFP